MQLHWARARQHQELSPRVPCALPSKQMVVEEGQAGLASSRWAVGVGVERERASVLAVSN